MGAFAYSSHAIGHRLIRTIPKMAILASEILKAQPALAPAYLVLIGASRLWLSNQGNRLRNNDLRIIRKKPDAAELRLAQPLWRTVQLFESWTTGRARLVTKPNPRSPISTLKRLEKEKSCLGDQRHLKICRHRNNAVHLPKLSLKAHYVSVR